MEKEEALQLLKAHLKPRIDGNFFEKYHIGEYIGDKNGAHIFTVYRIASNMPFNPNSAFSFFVLKESKNITNASSEESVDYLKWIQANCEKINITVNEWLPIIFCVIKLYIVNNVSIIYRYVINLLF